MNELPIQRVEIGGWVIEVKVAPGLEDWGNWDEDARTIWIGPLGMRTRKSFVETLRHEMDHAAQTIGGVAYCERFEGEAVTRCRDHLFWPAWDKIAKKL